MLQGQADGELTERGLQQAQRLGDRLKSQHFDIIYCSDLGRCRKTAEAILAYHPDTSVVYEPLLREKAAGEHEGKPIGCTEQEARRTGVPFRAFKGQGGESWLDVKARAELFLDGLLARHIDSGPIRILVVSHGGWLMELRNVMRVRQGMPEYYSNTSKNTALYVVRFRRNSQGIEQRYLLTNDASHLS